MGKRARATALRENDAVMQATIASLGDSVLLLADLWTSAWTAGGGEDIEDTDIVEFSESSLEEIYRNRLFVASLSLAEMVESGRFEP
jgi:hypothetical protein